MLDGEVGDAALGSQVVRLVQGVRRAGVDAQAAGAAVFLEGSIELEVDVGEQGAQEDVRADRGEQVGVLAAEAEPGAHGGVAFDQRAAVHEDARPHVARDALGQKRRQQPQAGFQRVVVVAAPGVAGDAAAAASFWLFCAIGDAHDDQRARAWQELLRAASPGACGPR